MAKATTANATAAEKDAEKVQAVENTSEAEKAAETANEQPETVKLIYIGPNLPKAMLQCNRIFEGTEEEIDKELSFILEKFPLVKKMLVPTTELAEKKDKEDSRERIQQVVFRLKSCRPCIRRTRTGGISNE